MQLINDHESSIGWLRGCVFSGRLGKIRSRNLMFPSKLLPLRLAGLSPISFCKKPSNFSFNKSVIVSHSNRVLVQCSKPCPEGGDDPWKLRYLERIKSLVDHVVDKAEDASDDGRFDHVLEPSRIGVGPAYNFKMATQPGLHFSSPFYG